MTDVETAPAQARPALGAPAVILAIGAAALTLFQLGLALGLPWGAASWGGGYDGTLPVGLRVASAVSAVVWALVTVVVLGHLIGPRGRRIVLLVVAVYSTLGIGLNAASPSGVERMVWTPVTVVMAVCAWLAWRQARRADEPSA